MALWLASLKPALGGLPTWASVSLGPKHWCLCLRL